VRREHTVEPDQGWGGGGISAGRRARNCSGAITQCTQTLCIAMRYRGAWLIALSRFAQASSWLYS